MHRVEGVRKTLRLAVDDDVDVALAPARDCLANVPVCRNEAQRAQHLTELLRLYLARAELDELDSLANRSRIRRTFHLLQQIFDGAHPVECDFGGGSRAKAVVENLE